MSRAAPRFRRPSPSLPALGFPAYLVQAQGHGEAGIFLVNFAYIANNVAQTAASEANIAASAAVAWAAAFRGCMNASYSLDAIKVTCVTTVTRQPFTNNTSAALGAGTIAGNPLPSTVAATIAKSTATKGQHGRGRNYMPGVPQSFITAATDPDRINAVGLVAYNAFVTALLNTALADGATNCNLAIYTRVAAGQPVTKGQLVTTCVMRSLLGTIRRRRVGRGK